MNEHLSVFYKRLTATVVMLAILFTSLPWIPVSTEVAAASTVTFGNTSVNLDYGPGSYFTDNGKACTDHGTKGIHSSTNESACNCKCKYNNISLGACQCFGYARYIQTVLFESNSFSKPSNFYEISGSYVAAGNLTATKLKNLMTSGEVKPGAHIRTNDGTSSKHSLIVTQITDSGFSIIQANGSNNNEYSGHSACRVGTYTYTWNSYVSSTYGKRGIAYIEMPREYTLPTNNYVNLGTGFYAVILNTNYWKPISYDTDGFIRLQSETGTANQVWRFDRQSDGSYVISNAQNGYALEMYYGNTTNGNPVAACSKDWGGYYQRWYIYQQGNGYILLSKHYSEKNLVLDLSDNNSTNGTPIITWPRHNGSSQIWSIYKENDVQIKSPTLNVSVGTSATNTKFTWSESYGEYSNGGYPLKIWKNKLYEGDAFHIEWEAKSGYSINLPAGTYQAYVDARNHFECKQSNVVTFTVKAVAPKAPQLTLSKTSLAIGEKVTVSWTESPGATYYWIECWHKGEHCINRSATVNPEILSFDDEGKYAINIIASNEAGGAISNVVEFYVGKYTISYNSNGGTGAPSNQTKNNGIDLTLSSSKPTKSYKITYNANGGSVSSSSKTVSAIFNNWKATDGKVYKPGDKYTANSATTLTAQWTNPTAGDLPTPTRTGYTFNGWYTAASGGSKITSTSTISANTTIYAQWTQIKYTVSFNANGGSGAPGNQTKIYGTDLTLSSSKPAKSYKITYNANGGSVSSSSKTVSAIFNNWKATDGKVYKPGDKYTTNSATTLTAQWTNPTAGDLPTPTRTGYTFNGWYTAASGGSKITSSSTISANTTIYAQWSANPTTTKSTTTTKATTTTKPTTTTKATTTTKPTTTTKATTTTKPTTTTKATTTTKPTTTTKATTTTKPTTTTKATTTTKPTTTTKATTTTKPTTTTKATTTTKPTTTTKATTTTKPTTTTKATTTTKPTTTTKATTTTKPTTTTKATTTAKPTTTTKATTTTKPTTTTTTKPTSSNGGVYRLSGSNRCKTAVEISKSSFKKASNVILASGDNYADALAGVPLADALDAPILLVRNHKLDDSTRSEIKRLGAKNIYILGGNAAIGENISSSLSSDGYNVTRVSGRNRFDTAVEIAEKLQSLTGNPREVFFAYSHNYPDALAISGIAAIKECPVLYIAGNGKLNDSTLEFLRSCGADKGTILGGTGAISADAEGNIENAGLGSVKRIAGKNRYDTCLKINKAYASVLSGDTVCVATGTNFPDALAGGVFASRSNAPLLLVGNDLNSDQKSYLSEYNAYNVYVFGGSGAVSEKIFNAIERIINQ